MTLLFFPASILFLEIMLRIFGGLQVTVPEIFATILVSVAGGLLMSLLCSISKSTKLNRWLGFVLLELNVIWFAMTTLIRTAFFSFMSIETIIKMTGDVAGGFSSNIWSTIGAGIPMILVYEIPVMAYAVLFLITKKFVFRHTGLKQNIINIILLIACEGAAFAVMLIPQDTRAKLTSGYQFDTAVKAENLHTATVLDLTYLVFGNSSARNIIIDPVEEPATEEPEEIETTTATVVYGYNVMDIDFDALIGNETNETIKTIHEYVSSLTASQQNEYTGIFEGKNLILITAEAFSKEAIVPELMPVLNRMATQGIIFEEYYQPDWHGSTSTGEFTNITGILPVDGVSSVTDTIGENMYFTMGNQLQRLGYYSLAAHNGYYEYYDRNLTHTNFGYSDFLAKEHGLDDLEGIWPESDKQMMELTLPLYIDKSPFSIYYMTISGHCNYGYDGSELVRRNWDAVKDLDVPDKIKGYYANNLEFEYALEYLVEELDKAGILEDTVFCIAPDHYPYGLEYSSSWGNDRNYIPDLYGYEPQNQFEEQHSVLLIWSPCLEDYDEPIVVSTPTYSIDIVPTLSNLFGVEYDSRLLVGRDALSDAEAVAIWPDYSWVSEYGYYDASSGTFTAKEGKAGTESYISRMNKIVANKIAFSRNILYYDYYNIIAEAIK